MIALNVGYNNLVMVGRVICVMAPTSASARRARDDARESFHLIDCTQGCKTRSMIVTDSKHVVLSILQPETVAQRLQEGADD